MRKREEKTDRKWSGVERSPLFSHDHLLELVRGWGRKDGGKEGGKKVRVIWKMQGGEVRGRQEEGKSQ